MGIEIVPHGDSHRDAVEAFNTRMRQGGTRWGFYVEPECHWIPKRPGRKVYREYFLAIENGSDVRGAYALKPQPWLIRGEEHTVADWQGPVSEGAFNNRYNTLGLRMVRDMLKKQPLLYSWGHGANDEPMVQMLRKMGWTMYDTPVCIKVFKPRRFLQKVEYLRKDARRRLALDALALSGAGSIGIPLMHAALRARSMRPLRGRVEVVSEFGSWADELWDRVKHDYAAIAFRDADSMNTLLPQSSWPPGIRLHVTSGDRTLGWAVVLDTQMSQDARFGDLRVGSIIDCLAAPNDAGTVAASATRFLRKRGVDLVISNQAHPSWIQGFGDYGYVILKNRRIFAASPKLVEALSPFDQVSRGLHLTNMDGHGPMLL